MAISVPIGLNDVEIQEYRRIQARFVDYLPTRLKELKVFQSAVEQKACLHRLAGAASSYGFNELGDLAVGLEASLQLTEQPLRNQDLSGLSEAIEKTIITYTKENAYGN